MRWSIVHIVVILAVSAWCFAILVPPVLSSLPGDTGRVAAASYTVFAPVCHQWDSHSLHLLGHKLGVCARCSAIYFGFLAGVLMQLPVRRMVLRRSALWLIFGALPMCVDAGLDIVGLHPGSITSRLLTGGLFGVISACVLLPSLVEAIRSLTTTLSPPQGTLYDTQTR
jgi:uncharacterized membrane protein